MLSERDLLDAIEKMEQKENLTPSQCIELSAFYTLLDKLYPMPGSEYEIGSYSEADERIENTINVDGNSDFILAIRGLPMQGVFDVIDELMITLQTINPRLYAGVMRKISG